MSPFEALNCTNANTVGEGRGSVALSRRAVSDNLSCRGGEGVVQWQSVVSIRYAVCKGREKKITAGNINKWQGGEGLVQTGKAVSIK